MKKSGLECFSCAFIQLLSNAAFGLAPLLFLLLLNPLLQHKNATSEIDRLIGGGIILFVCCALMGAVIIDILISKISFKRFAFFAVNISPFILLFFICLLYLLAILGSINPTIFTTFSKFYTFVIMFTIFYFILGKYLLYKND